MSWSIFSLNKKIYTYIFYNFPCLLEPMWQRVNKLIRRRENNHKTSFCSSNYVDVLFTFKKTQTLFLDLVLGFSKNTFF